MTSQEGGSSFRLNVLNPGGLDAEQDFSQGAAETPGEHAPVNYHAYAACTGGRFLRAIDRAVAAGTPVLLLLRGDFRASERALLALKRARVRVAISLKETGMHQIAEQLEDRARLERFMRIATEADGCLAPTPEAAEFYRACERSESSVAYIPTPYPMHDSRWDFSRAFEERRGLFIGTREWEISTRNHAAALFAARRISDATGEVVTVYNVEHRRGRRRLQQLGFPPERLRVLERTGDYAGYLRVMAQHKVTFQLDVSTVPGQVAGDALLCRVPCIGGHGTVERLAFPDLCGHDRSIDELTEMAIRLLRDDAERSAAVTKAQQLAAERLSFARAAAELEQFFARL